MLGEIVHDYRIEGGLAVDKGGMGDVYLAVHIHSRAEAVVKVLKPEMSSHRDIVTRFFNEARAAAQIQHPGIVAVHNVGYHRDRAFLLMERLRGEDLETRLQRGPLAVGQALTFLRQAAGAIGAAHAVGIVHRDLKPANLFVVPDPDVVGGERIRVLDFGIAKLSQDAGSSKTQGVFGTPAYMAPEQCAAARDVDGRTDLYALGCILYEMLAGAPPFGHGGLELVAAHLRDEPVPLRQRAPHVPEAVEAITMRLLRKDRAQRFASCDELVATLRALGDSTGLGASAQLAAAPGPAGPAYGSYPPPSTGGLGAARPAYPSPTTLGTAAGQVATAPRSRRGLLIAAIGGAALIAAVAAGVVLASGGGEPAAGTTATTTSTAAPPPVATAAAPTAPVAAPTTVPPPEPATTAPAAPEPAAPEPTEARVTPPRPATVPPPPVTRSKPSPPPAIVEQPDPPADADGLPDGLDRTMISAAITKIRGGIEACAALHDVTGTVKLKVTVAPNGRIIASSVSDAEPQAIACMRSVVDRAKFPATRSGGSFSYPFRFR